MPIIWVPMQCRYPNHPVAFVGHWQDYLAPKYITLMDFPLGDAFHMGFMDAVELSDTCSGLDSQLDNLFQKWSNFIPHHFQFAKIKLSGDVTGISSQNDLQLLFTNPRPLVLPGGCISSLHDLQPLSYPNIALSQFYTPFFANRPKTSIILQYSLGSIRKAIAFGSTVVSTFTCSILPDFMNFLCLATSSVCLNNISNFSATRWVLHLDKVVGSVGT